MVNRKSIKILLGTLFSLIVLLAVNIYFSPADELAVYFFDVGQGDAILIRTPAEQNIIIDGGPNNSFITQLGQSLPFYDRQIDLMILTHPHDDHLTGLIEVLKRYEVKKILTSGALHTTDNYLEWLKIIKEQQIPLTVAQAGQQFQFDDGVGIKVVYPFQAAANQQFENLNESSVVVQLNYGQTSFFFTGDLEHPGEQQIIEWQKQSQADLNSQVLKVGHHGSDTSSGQEFLELIGPEQAVIQVGEDNRYGHPAKITLERMQQLGIKLWRTDLDGTIMISSNGQELETKTLD